MHLNEYKRATTFYVTFMFGIFLTSPVLPTLLKQQGLTDIGLGILYSLMPLFLIFITPQLGRLSDSIGRNRIIYAVIIAEIIAYFSYSFMSHWLIISLTRLLDGLCVTTITVLSIARIEDHITKRRGYLAGASMSIEYLSRLIAPLLGGFLADYFFIRAPFLVTLAVLSLSLILLSTRDTMLKPFKRKDLLWITNIRRFLSHRELRGMGLLGIGMHATQPALILFLPLYITEQLQLSHSYVGYAIFALGFMHLFQFWFGMFSDRSPRYSVLIGCLLSSLMFISISFTTTYTTLIIFLFILGIGNSLWNISAWTLLSQIGERRHIEGEVVGSYVSIAKIGAFIGFFVSGFFFTQGGFQGLVLLSGSFLVLTILFSLFFFVPSLKRHTA